MDEIGKACWRISSHQHKRREIKFLCVSWLQALGIAIKLTFNGDNQLMFIETHVCLVVRLLVSWASW